MGSQLPATPDLEEIGYAPMSKGGPSPWFNAVCLLAVGILEDTWDVFLRDKIYVERPLTNFVG